MDRDATRARRAVLRWFDRYERPLPWRDTDAWGVLVSEFMLQQTPVSRVLPIWLDWRERWPTAPSLAAASRADVLRAWGGLGYPRRAARLHEAAAVIAELGAVPDTYDGLRALPGVGDYTAAAVLAFAFGQRSVVLDINVRRVIVRAFIGQGHPSAAASRAERDLAESLLPHKDAARWNAAVMELGALVCTSTPKCEDCPLRDCCRWRAQGSPEHPRPRQQPKFAGSDRQARGVVMRALRSSAVPVRIDDITWPDPRQLQRAIDSLHEDGLIVSTRRGLMLPD